MKATNLLCDRYIHSRYIPSDDDDWPPYHPEHYTPLTTVHHEGRCSESEVLASVQAAKSARVTKRGKSCNHFHNKSAKSIRELFVRFEGLTNCPYMILIEGVPGIGKTIMSKEIAFQWANKNLLRTIKILFLLFLRDPRVKNITDEQSLVKYFCRSESLANKISDWLTETGGEYLTIVLDGYDEMSKENRSRCIIDSIINRQMLPKCGVIITSRPGFSVHLHGKVSCRAEILGFNREDQQDFIQNALKGKNDKIKGLKGFLQSNLSLNALCCIPLNMSILLCLAEDGISALPKTQTRLYQKFILMTIVHFLKKDKIVDNTTITSLDSLPHPYDQIYRELSQFAFLALKKDQLVFTLAEVKAEYPNLTPANWYGLGLLKRAQYFKAQDGCDHESFHFLHHSIQEYMAACYIASLSGIELLSLLKETFWNIHYSNTWVMYVGITGGKHFMFTHFLSGNSLLYSWWFGIQNISTTILSNKLKCLHLLRFSAEAEHEMLSSVENIFQDNVLDLSYQFLSLNDVRILAELLLKLPRKKWKMLDLSGCGINDEACNLFCELLLPNDVALKVTTVDISDNHIYWESFNQLCKVLRNWKVNKVIMSFEALHDSKTMDVVNYFERTLHKKLAEIGGKYVSASDDLLLTYLPDQKTMIAMYACLCTFWCEFYTNCQLNDDLIEKLIILVQRYSRAKDFVPQVTVNFNIPSSLSNQRLSTVSCHFYHIVFKGLHMHSKGTFMLNHLSDVVPTDEERKNIVADFLMATLIHSNNSQFNKPYLKTIPALFAKRVIESYQDILRIRRIFIINANLDDRFARDIATVLAYNNSLERLCLNSSSLQSADAIKIAQGLRNIPTLKLITFNDNNIGKEAADDIASVLYHNTKLEILRLGKNNFQTIGAIKVAKALKNTFTLTRFEISENDINKEGADDIAKVLCSNTKLQALYLGGNNLQTAGIIKIAKGLCNTSTLTEFDIAGNNASEEAADDIAAVLSHNNKLQELNLSGNNLKGTGIIKIAKALENNPSTRTLTKIDVSNNKIGVDEIAVTKIAAVLHHCHELRELKLNDNNLQGMSVIKIARSLQRLSWLRMINFSSNNISAEAADDIATALSHKKYLYKLDLSENNFQAVGIIKISKALQNTSNLVELNFSSNSINDEAASDIAAALSQNNELVKLDLHDNELQAAGVIMIAEKLKNITTLELLNISDNNINEEAIDDIKDTLSHIMKLDIIS